jgi:hypothetical protein
MSFDELPKIPGSHSQSEESARALKTVLHLPDFIVREEMVYDYGCDFTIELGINARASNLRFQIQLKSEAQGTYVDDAKYMSVTMKTSRLHYLLRGAGRSIVVGYDQAGCRLYFEWVENLVSSLDAAGPGWRDQKTVQVRLPTTNELTDATAPAIHAEVLRSCRTQLDRESRPLEYSAALSRDAEEKIKASQDPIELLALLKAHGLAFISSGYHVEMLEVLERVPAARWAQSAPVLLTAAFAYFQVGLLLQALYYANQAQTIGASLGEEEQALLAHIQLSAKLAMGHVTTYAYYQSLAGIGERFRKTAVGLQARLESIAYEVNQRRRGLDQWKPIRQLVEQARDAFSAAVQHHASEEARWGLELILADIEFDAATVLAGHGAFEVRLAEDLKRPLSLQRRAKLAQRAVALMQAAAARTTAIRKAAREKGSREMEARALLTTVEASLKAWQMLSLASPEVQEVGDTAEGRGFLDGLLELAGRAQAIFAEIGLRQMSFRAIRVAAEILNVQGEDGRRDTLLLFLRDEAQVLGYHPDKVELTTMKKPLRKQPDGGEGQESRVAFWLSLSDEDLREYARVVLEALGLPANRLPHLEQEARARKAIAYEQLHHCKHIELLQNLEHTSSRATHYASDPAQVGRCERFGYQSRDEDEDFVAVVASFNKDYCERCTVKEPLYSNRGKEPQGHRP